MNILFLTDNFPPEVNAAASRVYERAQYWAAWGMDVTIITSAPNFPQGKVYAGYKNKLYTIEKMGALKVVRVKTWMAPNAGIFFRTLDFLSFMVTSFMAGIFQAKPDIVIATSPQFFTAVSGWGLSCIKRVPFMFEVADLWPESIQAVGLMQNSIVMTGLEKLELFLYRRATRIVVLTNAFKDNLVRRGILPDKIDVIVNGVEVSYFYPVVPSVALVEQYGLENRCVVGYIGTFGLAQGLLNVLQAAKLLKNETSIVFLMVGLGAEKQMLEQKASEWELTNVIFVAAQPKQDIKQYWALCKLALVSLKNHSVFSTVIPSKMFEAMAMQVPMVLVSPQGEASQVLEASGTGEWVMPENPEALAVALRALAWDKAKHVYYQAQCKSAVSHYTREKQARHWCEVFKKIGKT